MIVNTEFEKIINTAWDKKDKIDSKSDQSIIDAVKETIELVDKGKIRVAEKKGNEWVVHQWIKKAILLSFKTNEMQALAGPYATWWDKVKGKTAGWGEEEALVRAEASIKAGADAIMIHSKEKSVKYLGSN